jgi:hypothetical protein
MAPTLTPPRHPGTLPHAHRLASVRGGGAPRLALTGCPQDARCADRRRVLPPRLNASCRFAPAVAELDAWPNEGRGPGAPMLFVTMTLLPCVAQRGRNCPASAYTRLVDKIDYPSKYQSSRSGLTILHLRSTACLRPPNLRTRQPSLHVTALPIAEAPASPTCALSERVHLSPKALCRASPRRQR